MSTAPDDPERGLAAERTALAWNRTGMGFVVAGAVVVRLFPPPDEAFEAAIGAAMILSGGGLAVFAWRTRTRVATERAVRLLTGVTLVLAIATAVSTLLR